MNRSLPIAMDAAKVFAAVNAGQTADILRQIAELGFVFDESLGAIGLLKRPAHEMRLRIDPATGKLACDAQPELVTVNNAGIPAYLTNIFDPTLIEVATAPLEAVNIMGGEDKKGDWTTDTVTFTVIEYAGETSSYGDFNNNGMADGVNANFPQRQAYVYQGFTQWGEREAARYGLARIDWANRKNLATMKTMAQFQNNSYFFGISGLQNYGLLNEPSLPPAITTATPWNDSATTPEQIYNDVVRLFVQLQLQSNGVISPTASMTLALSNYSAPQLNKANQFGLTAAKLLKENYPNLTIKTAPQYAQQTGGYLVQLICNEVNGQPTVRPAFTEKMRAHAVVVGNSNWSQKKSAGTLGTVLYTPYAIASMIGV
jgi:hypothetical protein